MRGITTGDRRLPEIEWAKVRAIVERASGEHSYTSVLKRNGLTPDQFFLSTGRDLEHLMGFCRDGQSKVLEEIKRNPDAKRELFRMESDFIRLQRGWIHKGNQKSITPGTLAHPDNLPLVAYWFIAGAWPDTASKSRKKVVEGIKAQKPIRQKDLYDIYLRGLMVNTTCGNGKSNSPMAVLELFDRGYRELTGDPASLFDLTHEVHLHKWMDCCAKMPVKYWNDDTRDNAIYHTLCDKHESLRSKDRKMVVGGLLWLADEHSDLGNYFASIGLNGAMSSFENGKSKSPLAVFESFGRGYQKATGDNASLFNLEQEFHLHWWGTAFKAPQRYVKKTEDVETAIFHTLTEKHPVLATPDREAVKREIRQMPNQLHEYFKKTLDLGGIMQQGFPKGKTVSPRAVLEVYDRVWSRTFRQTPLHEGEDPLRYNSRNWLLRD